MHRVKQYVIKDNEIFPNSELPVLHYSQILKLPTFFRSRAVKKIFQEHGWTNNWRNGIYTFHHYHSVTHEVFGVIHGKTRLQLGGVNGTVIEIGKGDVVVIPAGVAHKNLGNEKDVICVGGYPDDLDYDMNYGKPGERPHTDLNIADVPMPDKDPIFGSEGLLCHIWRTAQNGALTETNLYSDTNKK